MWREVRDRWGDRGLNQVIQQITLLQWIFSSMWKLSHDSFRGRGSLRLRLTGHKGSAKIFFLYPIAMLHRVAFLRLQYLRHTYLKIHTSENRNVSQNVKESNIWDQPSHKILWTVFVCVCVCTYTSLSVHIF
jgi:hypothetical protein